MKDYCLASLSCGEKYNQHLKDNLLSNDQIAKEGADIFITTDNVDFFSGLGSNIKLFKIDPVFLEDVRNGRTKRWFNYHQKRIAIKNAFEGKYNKIFYIDGDIVINDWDKDFFIKEERGFYFRTFLSRNQHKEKYDFYSELFKVNLWHYYRPVSEKIIYINECSDKITGFLNAWDYLDDISRNKINPYSEGHEILIAARFNGGNVVKYKPDPFKGKKKYMEDMHIKR